MDAMYLNLMFINPSVRRPLYTAVVARPPPPPPATYPGSAPGLDPSPPPPIRYSAVLYKKQHKNHKLMKSRDGR